jgi:hypothetical protein
VIMVVGQKIALGRTHKHQTVTVLVSETTSPSSAATATPGSSAGQPPSRCVASRASGRGPLPQFPRPHVAHQLSDMRRTSVVVSQARDALDVVSGSVQAADFGGD